MSPRVLLLAVILSLALARVCGQCASIQGPSATSPTARPSRCFGILQYQVNLTVTASRGLGTCTRDLEDQLALADALAFQITSSCHRAFLVYMCAFLFPPCGQDALASVVPPDLCNDYNNNSICSVAERTLINQTYVLAKLPFDDGNAGFKASCPVPTAARTGIVKAAPVRKPLCEAYTGSVCKGTILPTEMVYVPQYAALPSGQTSQAAVEAQLTPAQFLANLLPVATGCRDAYWKLVCAASFPKCASVTNGVGATGRFPSLPAGDLCRTVHSLCPVTFTSALNSLANATGIFNCNAQRSISGGAEIQPVGACSNSQVMTASFPNVSTVIVVPSNPTATNLYYTVPNNPMSGTRDVSASLPSCPFPAVHPDDPSFEGVSGGSCAPPCPSLLYNQDQYDKADTLMSLLTCLGFVASSFLLLTYACFKRARRRVYQYYFAFGTWTTSLGLFFVVANEGPSSGNMAFNSVYTRYQCLDNTRSSKEGYCVFVSCVMVFGGLMAVCWWFLQALDLHLQISWGSRRWSHEKQRTKEILFYVWGFGYPIGCLLLLLGLDELGNSDQGLPWCFITNDDLAWSIFYAPIIAQSFFGSIFMVLIIRMLCQSSIAMGHHKKAGWYKLYYRPLLFVGVFLVVWVMIFAYRFSENFKEDQYRDDATELLRCLLLTKPSAAAAGQTITCPTGPKPQVNLWYTIQLAVAGVGLWTYLLYASFTHFKLWYHRLICDRKYNFDTSTQREPSTDGSRGSRGAARTTTRRQLAYTTKSNSSDNASTDKMVGTPLAASSSIDMAPKASDNA